MDNKRKKILVIDFIMIIIAIVLLVFGIILGEKLRIIVSIVLIIILALHIKAISYKK